LLKIIEFGEGVVEVLENGVNKMKICQQGGMQKRNLFKHFICSEK
jgi:hypothetical protein